MTIRIATNICFAVELEELEMPDWLDDESEDAVEM